MAVWQMRRNCHLATPWPTAAALCATGRSTASMAAACRRTGACSSSTTTRPSILAIR